MCCNYKSNLIMCDEYHHSWYHSVDWSTEKTVTLLDYVCTTSVGKEEVLVVQMCNVLKGRNIIFSHNCPVYLYSRYNSHQLISIHTLRYGERERKKEGEKQGEGKGG